MKNTNNLHIKSISPLISPKLLKQDLPMNEPSNDTVVKSRQIVENIIHKKDKRLLALVGPCSIHDPDAAMEYAGKLLRLREKINDRIYVIMRVYFEKPRTRLGWRGLILDPYLNGTNRIEDGLKIARKLLLDITSIGMPAGSEVLDPIIPQYISDLISWAAIGARTTESQTHREMSSGLSMPIGFKNAMDGSVESAVNAFASAVESHHFIGIDQQGRTCILETTGNPNGHLILRGGKTGPNYYEENIEKAELLLKKAHLPPAVMVDCSHANSGKRYIRQQRVFQNLLDQRVRGRESIIGLMLESNLFEGKQTLKEDISQLEYGVSITDECIGWDKTEELLINAYRLLSENTQVSKSVI